MGTLSTLAVLVKEKEFINLHRRRAGG